MASRSRSRRNTAGRGFVNNTILECLLNGDKYGYEIIKEVKDRTDGKVVLKEPSLYSSLKRFEQKGYISSYWGDSDIGGRRHYYSLTEPGRAYFNSLKSPKSFSITEENTIDDEKQEHVEQVEQISLENLDDEIYSFEEDNATDIDDSNYINNMSFNVDDEINKLLNSSQTKELDKELDDDSTISKNTNTQKIDDIVSLEPISEIEADEIEDVFEDNNANLENNVNNTDEENNADLINEINEAIKEDSTLSYNTDNVNQNENSNSSSTPIYEDYMFEHKFRKEHKQEVSCGKEKYVQYDLFNNNNNQINYVDNPSIQPSTKTSNEEKEQITANKTETEISKEIPLIKEQEVEFFNWNELKRQAVSNKSSFTNSSINKPTNNYGLDNTENFDDNINDFNKDANTKLNSYKSTSDLHKLFENEVNYDAKPSTKIFDNLSPVKNNTKIFDNVKERIELNDAVIGTNKPKYNDEPELTPEQIELLNKKFNEKFNQIAEEKVNSKPELDYKKILGDLYYGDNKDEREAQKENLYEYEPNVNENFEELKSEFVDNEIDEEKIKKAINNSKIYSYSTLKESLNNDGFKFKPYSIDIEDDETEQFVRINKVKFIYGTILSLLMILQTACVFICLKVNNLVYAYDIPLYIIAILAVIATFVAYLIPYISKKDERKIKYYNLNYHIMFGVLYLFCGLILTYAVNLILGLNHANTISFLTRLILPAILLTNFVIAPIIYKLVIENKNIK